MIPRRYIQRTVHLVEPLEIHLNRHPISGFHATKCNTSAFPDSFAGFSSPLYHREWLTERGTDSFRDYVPRAAH